MLDLEEGPILLGTVLVRPRTSHLEPYQLDRKGWVIPVGPGTAVQSLSAPVHWSPAQPAAVVPWLSVLRGDL